MKNRDSIHAKFLRQEYTFRINRVIDYIENNLDADLNLALLSNIANFSRFHFHRIFSAMTGETLNYFIRRKRLERSVSMLVDNPKYSITEIAFSCGFTSAAAFSRAFRLYFRIQPSELRNLGYKGYSKISKLKSKAGILNSKTGIIDSKPGKAKITSHEYLLPDFKPDKFRRLAMKVEIKDMPEMHVVYCRHVGSFSGVGEAFNKLMKWAGNRGLVRFPKTKILTVYHDDPEITDEDKLRSSACITVPENTSVDGEIGKMTIPGGKYAIGHFEITENEFSDAWNTMMGEWLPESGYQPDDRLPYELYYDHPKDGKGKFAFDICIPVKPL
ncbi:MAG: hypothetical protein AMS27_01740 [Bacteroides sp. SM23_62_1]|nr:MAG: hypothetical protein AMS27_01740 [Bacteroides sp. SM23_62_1]